MSEMVDPSRSCNWQAWGLHCLAYAHSGGLWALVLKEQWQQQRKSGRIIQTSMKAQMSSDAEIRSLLEARARFIHDKDARGTLGFYGHDIVNFDLAPPLAHRGREATDPAELQVWFDTWNGPICIALDQVEVRVANDLAFVFGFLHMTGRRTDGSDTDVWARITCGLERRSGEWKIVHEHQSFPMKMDGSGKSASDLRP